MKSFNRHIVAMMMFVLAAGLCVSSYASEKAGTDLEEGSETFAEERPSQ